MSTSKNTYKKIFLILGISALVLIALKFLLSDNDSLNFNTQNFYSPVEKIPPEERTVPDLIVLGARKEVEKKVTYDASYVVIDYPGGDVPQDRGACTDVVIRAFRNAGIDLQVLIHEDMQKNFAEYPNNWGLDKPDPNIDHRRVPNQMHFFKKHGLVLTTQVENHLTEWQWGDVVYFKFDNGLEHCGIISDRKNSKGIPLVIHNAGIATEEDCLKRWQIIGHYRYPP
ncbi:DUF1287 domain-containing protein [Thermosyntropha sp.]|uniref:DUF1287 domain-containing protein n=1 Tax=Thermosyntropha sp. TaxID=2740820 RepID=UPI0025DC83D4|nr:DUF1287 domain-containing protein [Thermosyntropha sp.]MBO8158761.1 DUF1287 domain-containing protein [Thermosyntropha sp.]